MNSFSFVSFLFCFTLFVTQLLESESKLTFPMIYKWSKRSKSVNGCSDPTEPFQCPGTDICISLQFLCDGHPGDCPNDYDEDHGLCVASKRPPKDTIRRFLTAQYKNYGSKFIEFMFGNKALAMFSKLPTMKAIEIISISLAVSPNIHEFAKVMEMTPVEKNRLALTLESIYTGQVGNLPIFVVNSASEGLSTIAEQLIRTQFLTENGNEN